MYIVPINNLNYSSSVFYRVYSSSMCMGNKSTVLYYIVSCEFYGQAQ